MRPAGDVRAFGGPADGQWFPYEPAPVIFDDPPVMVESSTDPTEPKLRGEHWYLLQKFGFHDDRQCRGRFLCDGGACCIVGWAFIRSGDNETIRYVSDSLRLVMLMAGVIR